MKKQFRFSLLWLCILFVTIILITACGHPQTKSNGIPPNDLAGGLPQELGNSHSNLTNNGLLARHGDWDYFYINPSSYYTNVPSGMSGGIYKVRKDGTQSTKLLSVDKINGRTAMAINLNVLGEWIYYTVTYMDFELSPHTEGIYKMKTDGTGQTKLSSDDVTQIVVIGEWIYYCINDGFYKMKTDGTQKTKLFAENGSGRFHLANEQLYRLIDVDNQTLALIRKQTDGTTKAQIPLTTHIGTVVIDKEQIYGLEVSDINQPVSFYRMNMDGSEKVILADTPSRNLTSFYVQEETLYYEDNIMSDSSINKITGNGMLQKIYTVKNGFIQILGIVGQQIYFVYSAKDTGDIMENCILYRINTDGTNLQRIE